MKQYFIIGTDTDCGKTHVTCHLIENLKQNHQRVLAIKPIASGCTELDGLLCSDDVQRLNRHNGVDYDDSLFWRFKRPISPHLAAAEEGSLLTANAIARSCQSFESFDLDYLLIEGAGGLMVPLNSQETWIDFLIQTGIPVILVVGIRLGCLNHALLTEAVLNMHQIQCHGWIANCIDREMLAVTENIATLTDKLSFPLLATIPFEGNQLSVLPIISL